MLTVPFALVGAVWLMWLLHHNLSMAMAVGFIALASVAAESPWLLRRLQPLKSGNRE